MHHPDLASFDLTPMERLLLMAAVVQGRLPGSDIDHANTAKIVAQVLWWTRMDYAAIRTRWECRDFDRETVDHIPELDEVYEPLIRMTQARIRTGGFRPAERPGPALFEGSGNWGVPGDPESCVADPFFNSCRLTALGEQLANALLTQHPEYRTRRSAGSFPIEADS
jgi:hypothetical protein